MRCVCVCTRARLTEQSEELRPAGLVLVAAALLAVGRQVMQLEQVDDGDVDQLLGAEGLLQDQPLHTHTHTESASRANGWPSVQGTQPHLEVLLQPLPQGVQLVHAPAQVDMAVELDEGSDEVRDAPLCLHLFAAAKTHRLSGGWPSNVVCVSSVCV